MRFLLLLASAAVAAVVVSSAAKAEDPGYALYMQWDDTDLRLEACKDRAEETLRAARFREDVTRTDNSVYARRNGGYTAGVRCIEPKKMVFFVISGPRGAVASKYLDEIVKGF